LRQALAKQPSREAGRRLKEVIERVERLPFASADTLRELLVEISANDQLATRLANLFKPELLFKITQWMAGVAH
jgi:hypothetical protein